MGSSARHHFEDPADGVAGAVGLVHHFLHARFDSGIHAAEQDLAALAQRHQFRPLHRAVEPDRTHGDDMAQHLDAEFAQKRFGHGPDSDAGGGLAGAGAFQNIPGVVKIVLDRARQIGMSRPRSRHRPPLVLRPGGVPGVLDGQGFGPVPPVLILDDDGHRRADGVGVAHPGHNFRAIGFDLHAAAAAVALLAAP